ncbi:MAG TPA: XylR family transcriptional regulator [Clostridia bacterium]|nr:XylR family transcriptional regulator [Clostridia bacterium]
MKELRHIVLMVDASRAYGRGICRGVANFAENREDWLILPHERPELNELPDWLKKSRVDGIIAYIPNRKLYQRISALGVPTVDVHGRCRTPLIPVIESDAQVIAALALQFFLKSGFQHLAYCGYPSVFFSDQREEAFRMQAVKLNRIAHIYALPSHNRVGEDLYQFEKGTATDEAGLATWLRSLPKPVAILACNDIRGQQVINACREAEIRMPEEVAVLGVDNDEIICRLCRPTLSTIEPDVERIGYLAGELIAAQLEGKSVGSSYQVPPRRVVERQSADMVVAGHPVVVSAARMIRDCDCAEISVEQICEAVGTSRSTLDKLFLTHLGRSVAGEMTRIRIQRSQSMLFNSDMPLAEIARRCGFSSATYFCRFFKRTTGQTPDSYRQTWRGAGKQEEGG